MASPGSFNDPFDCRIPENYHLLNTQDKIDQFMEYIESKHQEKLKSRCIIFKLIMTAFTSINIEHIFANVNSKNFLIYIHKN